GERGGGGREERRGRGLRLGAEHARRGVPRDHKRTEDRVALLPVWAGYTPPVGALKPPFSIVALVDRMGRSEVRRWKMNGKKRIGWAAGIAAAMLVTAAPAGAGDGLRGYPDGRGLNGTAGSPPLAYFPAHQISTLAQSGGAR